MKAMKKVLCATVILLAKNCFALGSQDNLRISNKEGNTSESRILFWMPWVRKSPRPSSVSSSFSSSLSFSFASAMRATELHDYRSLCLQQSSHFVAPYQDHDSSETINAFAVAVSEESLWRKSTCTSYAETYAKICAFSKVDGYINVEKQEQNMTTYLSMNVSLDMATTTFAMASSIAVAEAYADVEAKSFTSVETFCRQVRNRSPICPKGTASTDLKQIAIAKAKAVGQASSSASSGSASKTSAAIKVKGSQLEYISGIVEAFAKNWVFARVGTTVNAFANVFSEGSNESFSTICIVEHRRLCSESKNSGKGVCSLSPEDACVNAAAIGEAWVDELSVACSEAFIDGQASTEVSFFLSADVNCTDKPKLTWKSTNGLTQIKQKRRR